MNPLDGWLSAVQQELGLRDQVDVKGLLDLSRQVAHAVERPAAPLTTYLLGLAAGRAPGDGTDPSELAARVERLARDWAALDATRAHDPQKGTPAS